MSTTLFNDAAALCDQARPGYPEEALDAIVEMAGLVGDERAPEVGCGTGRVTIPFARRGYAILALEPGDALAGIAAARCRSFPDVRIEETRMAGRGGRLRSGRVGAGVSRDRSLPEPDLLLQGDRHGDREDGRCGDQKVRDGGACRPKKGPRHFPFATTGPVDLYLPSVLLPQ